MNPLDEWRHVNPLDEACEQLRRLAKERGWYTVGFAVRTDGRVSIYVDRNDHSSARIEADLDLNSAHPLPSVALEREMKK